MRSQYLQNCASHAPGHFPSADELAFWDMTSSFLEHSDGNDDVSSILREEPAGGKVYNLAERTARFGENIVRFAQTIPLNAVNNRLIDQLVGSGTSIGANYCEAEEGISPKDFRHRVSICRKESKETRFWLRMLATAEPSRKEAARALWREATELNLIFGAMWRKAGVVETPPHSH